MKKLYIVGLLFLAHGASADKKKLPISSLNAIGESMQKMDELLWKADILNGQEKFYQQLRNSYEESCNESKKPLLGASEECRASARFLTIAYPLVEDMYTKQARLEAALHKEVAWQKDMISRVNDSTTKKS
jgi:hypothetical protein